jgi:hypothetical protein
MNGVLTEGGKGYFMTLIDDANRFCYVYLLKMKDEALNYFKIYKPEVETQLEKKIKRLRSNRGGEYFSNDFDLFYAEHGIIHERTPHYSPQSNGVAERKNRTLSDLVNAMLDTAGLSKVWWGEAVLTACHILNRVPMKNKEKTPYEEWIGRKPSLSYLRTWGCLAKVNVPINKKWKLGPKTVDCIFLGYAHHSIAYRFLVVKSEVPDMHVNSLFESRDSTFFENIFPMKDLHVISSLPLNEIVNTISESVEFSEHDEHTLESNHEEIHSDAPRRSKRQKTAKSFSMISLFISQMILPKQSLRHSHLLMRMIGKKLSVARWTLFSPMQLGSWSKDHMVANLWVTSGCSRRSLSLMVLSTSTRLVLWLRVTPKKKAKISLILTHLLRD